MRERKLINQAEQSTAEHDGNDVPFPAQHSDEGDRANNDSKPVNCARVREENAKPKPHREIEDDTDNRRRDRGKRSRQLYVAAQFLDVRPAKKNPKKAGRERRPSGEQRA